MSARRRRLVIGIAVVLAVLACAFLTRYGYYRVEGPALYKVDRWTGKTWFITPHEIMVVPENPQPRSAPDYGNTNGPNGKSMIDVVEGDKQGKTLADITTEENKQRKGSE